MFFKAEGIVSGPMVGAKEEVLYVFFFLFTIVFTLCFWAFIRDSYSRSWLVYQIIVCLSLGCWAISPFSPSSKEPSLSWVMQAVRRNQALQPDLCQRSWSLETHLILLLPWEGRSGLKASCWASPQVSILTSFPFLVFSSRTESTPVIDHTNVHTPAVRKPSHSSPICR